MEKLNFHKQLKQCAIYSYGRNKKLPLGYECLYNRHDYTTGFQASVLQNKDNIIIAYVGTDSLMDFIHSDAAMFFQQLPVQYRQAQKLYEQVKQQYPNVHIILTGHSLGGSLAQIVGAIYDVETVTFNAYGTKNLIKSNMTVYPDKITNYINLDDYNVIINNTHNQISTCYIHGGNVIRSYLGKAIKNKSQDERNEFLDDYI